MSVTPVRKRTWQGDSTNPRDVGELARDLSQKLDGTPALKPYTVIGLYTEPMYLAIDHNPSVGIRLERVRIQNNQETVVTTGGMVHWVWDGALSRAKINSIDGMSPGSGLTYIFNFLVIG